MKIFIYKIPLHPPRYGSSTFPTGEFPLIKGGKGVVVPSLAITPPPSAPLFKITPPGSASPPLKIRGGQRGVMIPIGGRGSYDPEEGRF